MKRKSYQPFIFADTAAELLATPAEVGSRGYAEGQLYVRKPGGWILDTTGSSGADTDSITNLSNVPVTGGNTTAALNFLYNIHYPVAIKNIVLSQAAPANGLLKKGTPFTLASVSWTNQSGPTDVVISGPGFTTPVVTAGASTYLINRPPITSGPATYTVASTTGTIVSSSVTITWVTPVYSGVVTATTPGFPEPATTFPANSIAVEAGIEHVVDADKPFNINHPTAANELMWFAVPNTASPANWYIDALNKGAIENTGFIKFIANRGSYKLYGYVSSSANTKTIRIS